jgi:hypothetical protein
VQQGLQALDIVAPVIEDAEAAILIERSVVGT